MSLHFEHMGYSYDNRQPSLAAGSTSMLLMGQFSSTDFSPCLGCVFLLLCMSRNLHLDARHCEFCLAGCWVIWDSYTCSWSLFWNEVQLVGTLLLLLNVTFTTFEGSVELCPVWGSLFPTTEAQPF